MLPSLLNSSPMRQALKLPSTDDVATDVLPMSFVGDGLFPSRGVRVRVSMHEAHDVQGSDLSEILQIHCGCCGRIQSMT